MLGVKYFDPVSRKINKMQYKNVATDVKNVFDGLICEPEAVFVETSQAKKPREKTIWFDINIAIRI